MSENAVDLNSSARAIVMMAVPERASELEKLWGEHSPVFDEATDTGRFHMEAGAFGLILMTPRSMWIAWLLTHEAWVALNVDGTILMILELSTQEVWEHFGAILRLPGDQMHAEEQMDHIARSVDELRRGVDLAAFNWPDGVPIMVWVFRTGVQGGFADRIRGQIQEADDEEELYSTVQG